MKRQEFLGLTAAAASAAALHGRGYKAHGLGK
jgi:hypothetical protein